MFSSRQRSDWSSVMAVTLLAAGLGLGAAAVGAQADVPALKIRATNSYPQDQPVGRAMDFFAERVAELSVGKMTVQVFHAGKLYTEDRSLQAVLDGTVDIGMASASNHGPFTTAWAVVETPYLLDTEQFREVIIRGELGQEVRALSEKDGLRPMMIFETGGHRVVGGHREVRVPADLAQAKIRTAQSPVILEFYRATGANPTVVPWGETYLALANKTVDGLDAALGSWTAGNLWEVTTHVSTINWAPISTVTNVSVAWWNARTPGQREILDQAAREAEEFSMRAETENEIALRELITGEGVAIYDPTSEERALWREMGQTIWDKMPGVDQALIRRIDAAARAVR